MVSRTYVSIRAMRAVREEGDILPLGLVPYPATLIWPGTYGYIAKRLCTAMTVYFAFRLVYVSPHHAHRLVSKSVSVCFCAWCQWLYGNVMSAMWLSYIYSRMFCACATYFSMACTSQMPKNQSQSIYVLVKNFPRQHTPISP